MQIEPILNRITIYPVKSLDGVSLERAMITEGGCLLHDREYAIMDSVGKFVIGKTNPLVYSLRSTIDFVKKTISFRLKSESAWITFHLQDKSGIESYLSDYFGTPVYFLKNSTGRFLDIPDISGATVISESSLKAVSEWYKNLNLEETRKRFRATLEIEGVPAFWEDRLFSADGRAVEFKIGDVTLFGMSPRARCVVPTRNPDTGEVIHAFPKTFAKHRAATVPEWSELDEFGHHYYLSVDCRIPDSEIGKILSLGDQVEIV